MSKFAAVVAIINPRATKSAGSALSVLQASGRMEDVFPARSAKSLGGRRPHAVIYYTYSAEETGAVLAALNDDSAVTTAFVAPERHSWPRATQEATVGGPSTGWHYQDISCPAVIPSTSSLTIGIIDTGIDQSHVAFLGASIFREQEPDHVDKDGHGTHVAGIICASDETHGLRRLFDGKIIAYRALDPWNPKKYYNILSDAFARCDVINMSIGGQIDDLERELIEIAFEDNEKLVIVAAMGNESDDDGNAPSYPAALPEVIAVGASGKDRKRASFSNCGSHICICAPGVEILSTVPLDGSTKSERVDFDSWDGTSMATPIVAAACAMIRAKNPDFNRAQVRAALRARFATGQTSFDHEHGIGILDLEATLR